MDLLPLSFSGKGAMYCVRVALSHPRMSRWPRGGLPGNGSYPVASPTTPRHESVCQNGDWENDACGLGVRDRRTT